MALPRTLPGMWSNINRFMFDGLLPPAKEVKFAWVANNAEGEGIDTRSERAATTREEGGRWVVEINDALREFPELTYLSLAHEAIHVKLGLAVDHRSAAWNKEVRRLTGKGLLRRVI